MLPLQNPQIMPLCPSLHLILDIHQKSPHYHAFFAHKTRLHIHGRIVKQDAIVGSGS